MKIQVTIATGTERKCEIVDAASSIDGILARLRDPEVLAALQARPYGHLSIMAGPFDPMPSPVLKKREEGAKRAA